MCSPQAGGASGTCVGCVSASSCLGPSGARGHCCCHPLQTLPAPGCASSAQHSSASLCGGGVGVPRLLTSWRGTGSWGRLTSELLVGAMRSRPRMCSFRLHLSPEPGCLKTWMVSYLFLLPHPPSSFPNSICFPSLLVTVYDLSILATPALKPCYSHWDELVLLTGLLVSSLPPSPGPYSRAGSPSGISRPCPGALRGSSLQAEEKPQPAG